MSKKLKTSSFSQIAELDDEGLMCSLCQKCLSVSPIVFDKVHGNVCGRKRCKEISQMREDKMLQVAYEEFAKYLTFPCMYRDNGCVEDLEWGQVEDHETSCDFKNLPCPFDQRKFPLNSKEDCDWKGTCSQLLEHIETAHPKRMTYRNIFIPFNQNSECHLGEVFFTKIENTIVAVLFKINDDAKEMYCRVLTDLKIYKDLKYRVRILDESGKKFTELARRNADLMYPNFMKEEADKKWTMINAANVERILPEPLSIMIKFELRGVELRTVGDNNDQKTSNAYICSKCGKQNVGKMCGNGLPVFLNICGPLQFRLDTQSKPK